MLLDRVRVEPRARVVRPPQAPVLHRLGGYRLRVRDAVRRVRDGVRATMSLLLGLVLAAALGGEGDNVA